MFEKKARSYFGIIGIGRFGQAIAEALVGYGARVIVMDRNEDNLTNVQNIVEEVVIGDATDEQTLIDSGFQYTDLVIVSFAEDLATSILATMLLKEIGVKKLIAKARNLLHLRILKKIGADEVVLPEADSGRRLASKLISPGFQELLEITPGYAIADILIPTSFEGKNLIEIDLRNKFKVNALAIKRDNGEVLISPEPHTQFQKNDVITILGKDSDLKTLSDQ